MSTLLRGAAARTVAELGATALLGDLYDERGTATYHDTGILDDSEIRELSQLVRGHDGDVLELAAGTGRLTLPLLRLRRPVTALELSADMLEVLRELAATARGGELLDVVQADMSDFDLGRRFGVVVLGASSVSLLDAEGRRGLYAAVARHLADDGVLFLSVAETLHETAVDGVVDDSYDVTGRSGRRYRMHQYWEPGQERRTICVHPIDPDPDGLVPVSVSTPRVVDAAMVTAELAAAGLEVVATHPVVAGRGDLVTMVMLEVRPR